MAIIAYTSIIGTDVSVVISRKTFFWLRQKCMYTCACTHTMYIPYITNRSRWKSFEDFADQSATVKLFQRNSLCNRLWPYKTTVQLQMFSSESQFIFTYRETFPPRAICNIRYTTYTNVYTFI